MKGSEGIVRGWTTTSPGSRHRVGAARPDGGGARGRGGLEAVDLEVAARALGVAQLPVLERSSAVQSFPRIFKWGLSI